MTLKKQPLPSFALFSYEYIKTAENKKGTYDLFEAKYEDGSIISIKKYHHDILSHEPEDKNEQQCSETHLSGDDASMANLENI